MVKYLTNEKREQIVQSAVEGIKDKNAHQICRLYMKGFKDKEIMGRLGIMPKELAACKGMIRKALIDAGYPAGE